MDDLRHGEASLQNDPAKFRDSMVSGVFCSRFALPICSSVCSPNSLQKGVLANLVLAGDYTDNIDPDQDHQFRVVLEIRGILLEM
jgi:hypothetical protein